MKPTSEQEAILNADGRVTLVNARAGTGKTTSLVMLSEKHATERVLYLVFNRKAREAAQKRFGPNVKVHTVHSLAYRRGGYRWRDSLGGFSAGDMLCAFPDGSTRHQLAGISHQFLTYFLNSPHGRLEEAVEPFGNRLSLELKRVFERDEGRIVQACRRIATAWNRKERPCPHDFYLKMFHKSGAFDAELARYEMVLVDEAQDLSPVMLDALEQCRRRIVLVGDTHQQVYSFRYAVDAMQNMTGGEELQLSMSFRFGSSIADLASVFIQEAKAEKGFLLAGNPERASTISYSTLSSIRHQRVQQAILSRTNLSLFSNAMQLRDDGIPFRFERDLQPVLFRALDVYWLSRGERERVKDAFIGSFESIGQLETYAEDMSDFPLAGMAQIVKKYGDESFPSIVFEMSAGAKSAGEAGEVVLSTVHSAKGQEYDEVFIDSDVAHTLAAAEESGTEQYDEEVNIAYVGLTRVVRRLHLPPVFRTLLTDRWREHLRGCSAEHSKGTASRSGTHARRNPEVKVRRRRKE